MKLKPSIPFVELLVPPLFLYGFFSVLRLGINQGASGYIALSFILLAVAVGAFILINQNNPVIDLQQELTLKNFFFGARTIHTDEISGYAVTECRRGLLARKDIRLTLKGKTRKETVSLYKADYKEAEWNQFVIWVQRLGIPKVGLS